MITISANSGVLKEFLIALGIKDKFSNELDKTLQGGSQKVSSFVGKWGKQWLLAGAAAATGLATATIATGKFLYKLSVADEELVKIAKEMKISKDEAYAVKSALDVMGKSMDEIKANPQLLAQFEELRKHAEKIKPPDMSKGLQQVRDITGEFAKLKQTAAASIQWIGHHLLKYAAKPLEQIQGKLRGLNEIAIKNLPAWSEKIGHALSWVVKLGAALVRTYEGVFGAVKKVFSMIPGEAKVAMGALAALAMFIRAGPIGKLIAIIGVALLLLEDFFTYLDGGDALLTPVWKGLTDIWNILKDNGTVEKLKKTFTGTMEAIWGALIKGKDKIVGFWNALKENGAINNFKGSFAKAGTAVGKVFTAAKDILSALLGATSDLADTAQPFLAWLISNAIPSAIGLISDVAGGIAGVISWIAKLDGFKEVILTIAGAFGVWKAAQITLSIAQKAAVVVQEIQNLLIVASAIKTGGLAAAQTALAGAQGGATIAQWALNAAMSANPIALIIIGVAALIAIVVLLVKNWDKVAAFFKGLWEKIKAPFAGVPEWFLAKFTQAKKAVIAAFRSVVEWFAGIWQRIKDTFAGGDGFFSQIAGTWFRGIEAAFGIIVDWFKMIWENIKLVFSVVKSVLAGDFQGAYDGIIKIWENIVAFFTSLVGRITGVFQPLIDWLLGKFGKIGEVISGMAGKVKDFFGGGDVPDPSGGAPSPGGSQGGMPGHEDGGVFNKEHDASFCENDKAEAVVPLTKPQRAKEVLGHVAQYLGGGDSGETAKALQSLAEKTVGVLGKIADAVDRATAPTQIPAMAQAGGGMSAMDKITSVCSALEKIIGSMSQMDATVTQGTAMATASPGGSGGIVNNYNEYDMRSETKVYDQSGNPQGVANAVDRAQQLRIRNMKGVFK